MRKWTEASFEAACVLDEDDATPVVWLSSRDARRDPATARPHPIRHGIARWSRSAVLVGIGITGSSLVPGTALAPVTPARASVAVAVPELPLPVVIAVEPAPVFRPSLEEETREAAVDDQRREVEEFLSFGARSLPRSLVSTIVDAARATDVDPIYLMALADKESSFRTGVKASTSSAEGLFQFIDRTWLEMVRTFGDKHGLERDAALIDMADERPVVADAAERARILDKRRDPYVAAVMAAELLKRDAALIGFRIGRRLSPTELYIAHFLGLEDAARFLEMKSAKRPHNAVSAFPAAARANTAIFFDVNKRKRRGLSVPEVFARIDRMIEPRVERYKSVEALAQLRL